jgi:hypothetical protein
VPSAWRTVRIWFGQSVRVDVGEFEARQERLLTALDQASSLLEQHGERRWATWLAADRQRIDNGDRYGLEHVLQGFGGMGSLTDLVFGPINGNSDNEEVGTRDTERLRQLTNTVFVEATAMRRALDRP